MLKNKYSVFKNKRKIKRRKVRISYNTLYLDYR